MPLLDHFHPPLRLRRHWESFHALWTAQMVRTLNGSVLPKDCYAEAQVHVGSRVEVDVGTFHGENEPIAQAAESGGGVAVETWAPPATALIMPTSFPDEIEVQIFREFGGNVLVGAIELVSTGNKDRPEHRRAFAAKCSAYLQRGVGLVVVDIVTERSANLHDELIALMEQPADYKFSADASLYTAAYRPSRKSSGDQIELWLNALALGQALPTMPLPLRGVGTFPLDLETTYQATCRDCRL